MFLKFPIPGERFDSMRSLAASKGRFMRLLRVPLSLILPMLLLVLGGGCHHGSDPNATGTPPNITLQPVDTSTVTGRPLTFTITATGAPILAYQWSKDGTAILGALGSTFTLFDPQAADAGRYSVKVTNDAGSVTSYAATLTVVPALQFTAPVGLVYDGSGNLYVSDQTDHVVWKVSPAKQVTLLAGTVGIPGSADGLGGAAQFRNPGCLVLDPAGNLLVADTGNHTIRRIAPDGTVTTLAGAPGLPGAIDAKGTLARFNAPSGLAMDASGGVYIADSQNHTIRFMAVDGTVSTYAGSAGQPGSTDASGTSAQFDQPNGLALAPNGTLYVADYGNSTIRIISPNALVSTLAGTAGSPGYLDGTGGAVQFNLPVDIALDGSGLLWVADTHNHAIRTVAADGTVTVVAGSGSSGNADGTGIAALFNLPCGILLAPGGNLLVADTGNHMVRLVTPDGVVTTL
jgi:sugar lactone lactonase YvrE